MNIKMVGVIGAGVMGIGVAQNLAQTDHQVLLVDTSENILDKAKQEIRNNIRFQGFFKKGEREGSPDDIIAKIGLISELFLKLQAFYISFLI
ncbi:3-hydroxyacyl-CoA dehydrogenase NAD-binding domain-containing protein [Nostoc favosum]|uniref:NAD-binding protein n=1 Tax=Nostoc favosum CHAB5714 TaxID=2780399 RepID=A0ABS8IH05_9NOSO|nr:3-hydroxyacyl-CoA dehydrogenase NAD-binding domain-containing protein [Nostoc favosum]MCC5603393.1 NAD-binding protein [Nostoc favosum CHAB5714]